jgi:hypothetical protein
MPIGWPRRCPCWQATIKKTPQRDHEHATRQATLQREVGDSNARG